jgi:hypothetical protein
VRLSASGAAYDGRAVVALFEEAFFAIEAQFGFAAAGVGAVAVETVFGEDRANVSVEAQGSFRPAGGNGSLGRKHGAGH